MPGGVAGGAGGVRRRTFVAAGAAAASGLAGCGRSRPAVQVVAVWSGTELSRFRQVVRRYRDPVHVISASDNIDAFLRNRAQTGGLPDVAILPHPGLVREYAERWLAPMPAGIRQRFPDRWNQLLTVDGELYGAWVKAAHKSLFWYLDGTLPRPPATWDELVRVTTELAASGGPAPLAVGAADGWVLTDWLENLLAALLPGLDRYDAALRPDWDWRAEPVRTALEMLGRLWRIPGAFPSGPRRALLTQYEESVLDVVARRRAAMVFEGDFVLDVANEFAPGERDALRTFRFPAVGGARPLLVGGDAAVVFQHSRTGHDLVEWLTQGRRPFRSWIDNGGYLSPNRLIPISAYPNRLSRQFVGELLSLDEEPRFDLSDQLPSTFGATNGLGMWRILQDFFATVARPRADVPATVAATTRELARVAERTYRAAR